MYIAMNRFQIRAGQEEEFEEVWSKRKSYLGDVEGFLDFRLLRGNQGDEITVFLSHSTWESEKAFIAWTESSAFRKAHGGAKTPQGVVVGPPQFEGYLVVESR